MDSSLRVLFGDNYGNAFCGDYTSHLLFAMKQKDGVLKSARLIGKAPQPVESFGEDEAGNLYVVGFDGMIYLVDFSSARFDEVKPGQSVAN